MSVINQNTDTQMPTATADMGERVDTTTTTGAKKMKRKVVKKVDPVTELLQSDTKELLDKMNDEPEWATLLIEKLPVIQNAVKQYKAAKKEAEKAAKEVVATEKQAVERGKLFETIAKLRQAAPELFKDEGNGYDDLTNEDLKGFIKTTKMVIKDRAEKVKADKKAEQEAKKAEREAKKAEREAKKVEREAKKAEREAKKAERDAVKRDKLIAQLSKFVENLDFVPDYDEESTELKDLEAIHKRCKLLTQVKQFAEKVSQIPEYDEEDIADDALEAMHARAKVISQLNKIRDEALNYDCGQTVDELKEMVAQAKADASK